MRRAWGGEASTGDRRRIVLAAILFGRQFEQRVPEQNPGEDTRRLLMDVMNGVIREFADREGMDAGEAAKFLGEVGTRDRVLEFSETLDEHRKTGGPIDELLNEAVDLRRERAFRANREPG